MYSILEILAIARHFLSLFWSLYVSINVVNNMMYKRSLSSHYPALQQLITMVKQSVIYHQRLQILGLTTYETRKRGRAQRKGRPLLPPSECYWLVNASPPNYRRMARFSMGLNYGPIFCHLWTNIHQIMSADTGLMGEIVVCNAIFRLSISCSVPEIFACFSAQNFFGGRTSKFWTYFLKLHLFPIMWQSFAAIGRQTAKISCWRKQESPAVADKPARCLRKVCTVYVRAVGL